MSREKLIRKIREGWDRIAREHPDLNWSLDTEETLRAELQTDNAAYDYIHNGGDLLTVKQKFDEWEATQVNKRKELVLF